MTNNYVKFFLPLVFALLSLSSVAQNAAFYNPTPGFQTIEGLSTQTLSAAWSPNDTMSGIVTYQFVVDVVGGTHLPGIAVFDADNSGQDTTFTLTYEQVLAFMTTAGAQFGDTLMYDCKVRAFNGTTAVFSDNTYLLQLIYGNVIAPFNQLTPTSGTNVVIQGSPLQKLEITWEKSGDQAMYNWELFTTTFVNPTPQVIFSRRSTDTVVRINYSLIDALLDQNNIAVGSTFPPAPLVNLRWRTSAMGGGDSIVAANAPFDISLTRGTLSPSFSLLTPAIFSNLNIGGDSTQTVNLSWKRADNIFGHSGLTYIWLYDVNQPGILSNNNGADTSLTLSYAQIDNILAANGVGYGNTLNTVWAVVATDGVDSLFSEQLFNISLTRSGFFNIDLVNPPAGLATTVEGYANSQYDIQWTNGGADLTTYEWVLDTLGGDFSSPIASISTADTSISLSLATVDTLLQNLGVALGNQASLQWTVFGETANNYRVAANDTFALNLTKGNVMFDFNLMSPANAAALNVEGYAGNEVTINWNQSGSSATYTWLADLATNFTAPLLALPSNNNGADTALTLTIGDIDDLLAQLGIAQGQSATLNWTVQSVLGPDTIFSLDTFSVTLNRGVVLYDFNLLNPADGATLNVEGLPSNTATINWNSAGDGLTYTWLADVATNFNSPLLSLPSNNTGSDTALTLDFATLDQVLANAGVAVGGSVTLNWTVKANSANDSIFALDTFSVTLNRNGLLADFNLIAPANPTSVTVAGRFDNEVNISWQAAAPNASYFWVADELGALAVPSLSLASNNSGADTMLTLDYAALNAVLTQQGFTVGQTVSYLWSVIAVQGGDTLMAQDTFQVNFTVGELLSSFNLLAPANAAAVTLAGLPSTQLNISWEESNANASYVWVASAVGGLANPALVIPSNNSGADTVLTLTYQDIDAALQSLGVPQGGSFTLQWTALAILAGDTLPANASRTATFTRGALLKNFNLLAPADSTSLTVSGNGTNTVQIRWNRSVAGAQYTWMADPAFNFITPLLGLPSNGSGVDTVLTFTYQQLDQILASAGLNVGQSVTLNWTVLAQAANASLFANDTFQITLTRGVIIKPFNLLAPNNNTVVQVRGLSENTIVARWQSAGANVTYLWELDRTINNFANPMARIVVANDTSLTLDFATVENVLIASGFNVNQLAACKWRVRATDGVDTLNSTTTRNISFNRGIVIRPFGIAAPANNAVVAVAGKASKIAAPTWDASSFGPANYRFQLDTLGGDFNPPVLNLTPANLGLDTFINLDYGTLESFLESNNVGLGGTYSAIWRVQALSGIQSRFSTDTFRVDFTRDYVLSDFQLQQPVNNTNLVVQGNDTTQVFANWRSSGLSGITYEWMLDTAGANFSAPLISINANTDTFISLTRADILSFLQSQNIPFGGFGSFQWTVRAFGAGDTLFSVDTYNLRLTRGTVLQDFAVLSPANNTQLILQNVGTQTVNINWEKGGDGSPGHQWQLDAAGGNFASPLAVINANNNGLDTNLTLTYTQIDDLLASLNVLVGDTARLSWRIVSLVGNEQRVSTNVHNLDIVRGTVIRTFNLLTPPNNTRLVVAGASSNVANISWTKSGAGAITYTWLLDAPGGNFSNPLASIPSTQNGLDSFLLLSFGDIDALLASLGLNVGDSVDAIWTVRSSNGLATLDADNGPYNIRLIRQNVLNPYTITAPASGFFGAIQGDGNQNVNITWGSAGLGNYTYEWIIDAKGGNFSPPLAVIPADNNGTATSLNLEFRAINGLLASLGVGIGDTLEAIWSVRATDGTDILVAQNSHDITLRRGVITVPFNLTGPADGTSISIPDAPASSSVVNITWENADETGATNGLTYNWIIDEASGDYSSPLATVPSANVGRNPFLTLPYSQISQLLINNNIAIGQSLETKWTVRATEGSLTQFAVEDFMLTLTRVNAVGIDGVNEVVVAAYPNPANAWLNVTVGNAKVKASDIRLYNMIGNVVEVDIQQGNGGNFTLNTSNLAVGQYFLQIQNSNFEFNQKVMIQH